MHTEELGGSANKFRKSQIRKFADIPHVSRLAELRFADPIFLGLADLGVEAPVFCGLKNFRKFVIIILTR